MRILQIITLSELGGAQTVVVNLSNKLSENHEVIVVAGEGDGKMWQMLHSDVKQEHCKYLKRVRGEKRNVSICGRPEND